MPALDDGKGPMRQFQADFLARHRRRRVVGQRHLAIDGAQGADQTDECQIADIRISFMAKSRFDRFAVTPLGGGSVVSPARVVSGIYQ